MQNPVTLTVEGQQLGIKKPIFPSQKIEFPDNLSTQTQVSTLRNIIHYLVQLEVEAFHQRQANRQLFRLLTAQQIEAEKKSGRIDPAAKNQKQMINLEDAQKIAIQAFDDGLYFVFVDDQQVETVDEPIQLTANSTLKFIRLVALAGG